MAWLPLQLHLPALYLQPWSPQALSSSSIIQTSIISILTLAQLHISFWKTGIFSRSVHISVKRKPDSSLLESLGVFSYWCGGINFKVSIYAACTNFSLLSKTKQEREGGKQAVAPSEPHKDGENIYYCCCNLRKKKKLFPCRTFEIYTATKGMSPTGRHYYVCSRYTK